jgi:hypothetical protein
VRNLLNSSRVQGGELWTADKYVELQTAGGNAGAAGAGGSKGRGKTTAAAAGGSGGSGGGGVLFNGGGAGKVTTGGGAGILSCHNEWKLFNGNAEHETRSVSQSVGHR